MPGYYKSRFINLKDEDELMCGICHGIFFNPKVTPCCRQTYCGDCIEQWLQENSSCPNDRQPLQVNNLFLPPRFVYNMLNKLIISCEFSENGCVENIMLENIAKHLGKCLFNPNNICNDCNHIIGNKSKHNCLENLKSDNKKLSENKNEIKHQYNLCERKFNALSEKYDKTLIELNMLKEQKSKVEVELNSIKGENKYLHMFNDKLLETVENLKEVSSSLYEKLKFIESDKLLSETNDDSFHNEFNKFIKSMEIYLVRKNIDIIHRKDFKNNLSKFVSNIETNQLFKDLNIGNSLMASNSMSKLENNPNTYYALKSTSKNDVKLYINLKCIFDSSREWMNSNNYAVILKSNKIHPKEKDAIITYSRDCIKNCDSFEAVSLSLVEKLKYSKNIHIEIFVKNYGYIGNIYKHYQSSYFLIEIGEICIGFMFRYNRQF